MERTQGSGQMPRGTPVAWDYERHAQRAIAEEQGEIARMHAEFVAVHDHLVQIAEVAMAHEQERQSLLLSVQDGATNLELLAHDRAELLSKVLQQSEQLGQSRAELDALRRSAAISRGVMVDILGSRGYFMMRLLGRWRAIERGIQRALREN